MRKNGIGLLRLRRTLHPNHVRIARGLVVVGLFLATAKLIGAVKEMIIAQRYGVAGVVDAYMLAFTFVTWLPQIAWSVGSLVLVPVLVALRKRPDEEQQFFQELNGSALQLGLATVALVIGLGGGLIPVLVSGWTADAQDLARRFTWQLAPAGLLLVFSASLSIRLQALERQSYTLLEAMPALGILSFLLLLPNYVGGAPLVWGLLAGATAQVALLIWMAGRTRSLGGGVKWRRRSPLWNKVYASLGVMAGGQAAISLVAPIDNAFAAQLGEGAIAVLGYANRLVALLAGLAATTIGRAVLPVLSQTVTEGKLQVGLRQAQQWAGIVFLATGIAAFLGWWIAPQAVALVFQRGAFTAGDTVVVARVLRFGLLQLPFYCSGIVLVQWFAATRRYRVLVGTALLGVVAKCALNAALVGVLGVGGIALATTAMYLFNFSILLVLARRKRTWEN